jgi:DNA-binding protein HU-beta
VAPQGVGLRVLNSFGCILFSKGGDKSDGSDLAKFLFYIVLKSIGGGKRMTKADLVAKVAGDSKITKAQAEKAVDGFVTAVSAALADGEKVTLVGFGTFSVGTRSAREGRNPRTGDKITIPASKVVKFKPGKSLSEKVK